TLFVVSSWRVVVTCNPNKCMSTKSPECWASDPNARAVKVELSAEQSLLLPFDQFAFAELKSEGKQQHLRLVFATHEISIRGHALRRIEAAMQRMELSLLAALSGNLEINVEVFQYRRCDWPQQSAGHRDHSA